MASYSPVPLTFSRLPVPEMIARARAYAGNMQTRRTVRDYSSEPIPVEVIEAAIQAASSAPSGAHQQPWTFVVVSDRAKKQAIRRAAEAEEQKSYRGRMSAEWLAALEPLGTDWRKPHLTDAPIVIIVFAHVWGVRQGSDGTPERVKHYYVDESVGIAVGMLLSCLHLAGLAALTHTPSPMRFLRELCGRPEHERPFVVIPVGYPAAGAEVPDLVRKPLGDVMLRI